MTKYRLALVLLCIGILGALSFITISQPKSDSGSAQAAGQPQTAVQWQMANEKPYIPGSFREEERIGAYVATTAVQPQTAVQRQMTNEKPYMPGSFREEKRIGAYVATTIFQ